MADSVLLSRKRVRVQDPINARIEYIRGRESLGEKALSDEHLKAEDAIRKVIHRAAVDIKHIADSMPQSVPSGDTKPVPKYDVGRMIAAMDALESAANIAVASLRLPHVEQDAVVAYSTGVEKQ